MPDASGAGKNLKLDKSPSQTRNPEISNCTRIGGKLPIKTAGKARQFNLRFRDFGFEVGFRPISRFHPSSRYLPKLLLLLLLFTAPCLAQEAPAWQFFGGYSFQRADVREYFKTTPIIYSFRHHYVNMNGWDFAVTQNRNRWFGGTLDLSGYTRTPQFKGVSNREEIYSILYGPRITYRGANVPNPAGKALWGGSAFAHVLFGATHTSVSVTPTGPHATDFTFGMALGGGFDLPLRNELSVRVLQAEYLRNSSFGGGQNNYRLSAGVAFNLGKAK